MDLSASPDPIEADKKGICRIGREEYPAVGFGTYLLTGKIGTKAVALAAKNGYRIIDTATFYENFDAIAKALKDFERSRFYIISKVWHDNHSPSGLYKDLNFTLDQLQTNYLDAYLLHWPNSNVPIEDTLEAMEELRQKKKIRHIGLSNVTANHVKRVLELSIPVSWVQVEMNPFFYDVDLLKVCQEKSITIQAWAPIGRGRIKQDEMLTRIGKKYGKSAAQVALRWIIQHGCIPLPASKDEKHIQENFNVVDFALSREEMEEINLRAKTGQRERLNKEFVGFSDEFDFSYEECWPKKGIV